MGMGIGIYIPIIRIPIIACLNHIPCLDHGTYMYIYIYTFFYGEQQEVFLRLAIESLGHMILQSVSQRKLRNRKNERGWREEKERCFFFFLASFLILTSLYLLQVGPSWVFLGGTLESLECLCRSSFLSFTGRVQCIEGQVSEGPWWHHRTTKTHLFLERSIGYFQAFHWERVSKHVLWATKTKQSNTSNAARLLAAFVAPYEKAIWSSHAAQVVFSIPASLLGSIGLKEPYARELKR